mmetsp:Transcript_15463/g.34608  ORF Transcript_15463/g.34608 Transcript_15463/m.34608 type:complete len:218 (-) Transcript_15463:1595-2248(-)
MSTWRGFSGVPPPALCACWKCLARASRAIRLASSLAERATCSICLLASLVLSLAAFFLADRSAAALLASLLCAASFSAAARIASGVAAAAASAAAMAAAASASASSRAASLSAAASAAALWISSSSRAATMQALTICTACCLHAISSSSASRWVASAASCLAFAAAAFRFAASSFLPLGVRGPRPGVPGLCPSSCSFAPFFGSRRVESSPALYRCAC